MEKLSVVIPCYKSESMIRTVVQETVCALVKRPEYTYEIILVNDGSPDGTWRELQQLARENKNIKSINLARNFGQHAALMAGYRAVTGDIVVGLDDDGEHDPGYIYDLVDKLNEGYDYVCAHFTENPPRGLRKLGTAANAKMAEILIDKPQDAELSSFYVERRFVTDYITTCSNPFPYIAGLLLQATRNMAVIDVPKRKRLEGNSGYALKKLIGLWINGFTAFSVKPLRIATLLGALVACAGFLSGIVVIIRKLCDPAILTGYSSLMAGLLFIGGCILLSLGLIGEYVGRIYLNINHIPQYVIRETINCGDKTEVEP